MLWESILFYFLILLCALLVAIPVFAAARLLVRRFWRAHVYPNRTALLAAVVATPLLCVAGAYLALFLYLYYPHREFEPARWTVEKEKRYEMVEDLQASRRLVGLTEKQVIALLGLPDIKFSSDGSWEYYLGMKPKLIPIDADALSLKFRNGKVVRLWVHET